MPNKLIKKQVAGNELRKKLLIGIIAAASANHAIDKRPNRARHQMVWEERVASLSDSEFEQRYRLDLEGFNQVLEKIRPALGRVHENVPTQVAPELKLSMALRWMAGGSYLDIADLHGVEVSTFYKHLWTTIEAIDAAYELPLLAMLDNIEQGSLAPLIDGFDEKSAGVIRGCFGAVDGLAVKIEKPDTVDASSYYCRKGFYSVRTTSLSVISLPTLLLTPPQINFQCVCDAERRFTWCSALTCGSTHDSCALGLSELGEILADPDHPVNHTDAWISADDAYTGPANCSDSILTPFQGRNLSLAKDCFNFWQSRLRIEIECAFGALVARWGCLQRALKVSVEHATLLLCVLCKLHNVCMDRRMPMYRNGRLSMDAYDHTKTNGDEFGADWAEWDIAAMYFDEADRGAANRGRTAQKQRLRTVLLDTIREEKMVRPSRSECEVYRRQRRGLPAL
jgi:hypothetical protein